jgi:subtilisin family serine protease
VEAYLVTGSFTTYDENPLLCAGECTHNIHSPSSAPSVICVGGTIYRQGIVNYLGKWKSAEEGGGGERGTYSSVGPTMDGRIKPDVMAPGANIISSYSSYYLENNPLAADITWDVAHFPFNGRSYAWNCNSGTSMSCPAVAGAIALWLQAKPDLTPEEVLDVFSHTCRRYDEALPYPNNEYGYGEVDAYHGLLYLLSFSNIDELSTYHTPANISLKGSTLHLDFGTPTTAPVRLRLFDISGMQRLTMTIPTGSSSHALTLPMLSHGVYAVQIDGPAEVKGSTLIRL